jgi:hypothetical protein
MDGATATDDRAAMHDGTAAYDRATAINGRGAHAAGAIDALSAVDDRIGGRFGTEESE